MSPADVELVGILLEHVGQPSMLVTGKKSALPADDRVGILLNHITPSMAARLARGALGEPRLRPRLAGIGPAVGQPSMARILQHKATGGKVGPLSGLMAVGPSRLAWRLRCEFRSAPLEGCGVSGPARAFNEEIDSPFEPRRPEPSPPPLGWPWQDPLPPTLPATQCPYPTDGPSRVGTMLDLLA